MLFQVLTWFKQYFIYEGLVCSLKMDGMRFFVYIVLRSYQPKAGNIFTTVGLLKLEAGLLVGAT